MIMALGYLMSLGVIGLVAEAPKVQNRIDEQSATPQRTLPANPADCEGVIFDNWFLNSTQARGLHTGDLDGDGDRDLLVSDNGGELRVLINQGDGTFDDVVVYPQDENTVFVSLGDMDGDGDLDVVGSGQVNTKNGIVDKIWARLNNGDGTFAEVNSSTPVPIFGPMALGDVDGDGDLDAVLSAGWMIVVLNNGDATFSDPELYDLDFYPQTIRLGDLDGDGDLDAVFPTSGGRVEILFNNGDGTFGPNSVVYFLGILVGDGIVIEDLDGDSALDIVIGGRYSGPIVLLNNGDGTFPIITSWFVDSDAQYLLEAGDIDGDGDTDLLMATGSSTLVFPNIGDGSFPVVERCFVGGEPSSAFVTDLNGDGTLDIGLIVSGENLMVRLNNGTGGFTCVPTYDVQAGSGIRELVDVDDDGDLDVILNNTSSISIMPNEGNGTFGQGVTYPMLPGDVGDITVGDVNGDGHPDLIASQTAGITVRLNDGNGFFDGDILLSTGSDAIASVQSAADFDGDGVLDIAMVSTNVGLRGHLYRLLRIWFGNGDGTFQIGAWSLITSSAWYIAIGDLNGDGALDIALSNPGYSHNYVFGHIEVLFNTGNGTFTEGAPVADDKYPGLIKINDLNGDGAMDLMGVNISTGKDPMSRAFVALNNGDGTFAAATSYFVGEDPMSIDVADFDGDGDLDIASGCKDGRLSILMNSGDGTFPDRLAFGGPDFPRWRGAAGDLDNDGHPDLLLCDYDDNLWVYLNICSTGVCTVDMDGDQIVGVTELLAVLDLWGTNPNGPPDFDGDGVVSFNDLMLVINSWGPCP